MGDMVPHVVGRNAAGPTIIKDKYKTTPAERRALTLRNARLLRAQGLSVEEVERILRKKSSL